MSSLGEFGRRMRVYASKIGEAGDEAVMAASSATLQVLAYDTPVDTGKAISNWQVGIGSSPSGELEPFVPGLKGSTADANRLAMLESTLAQVAKYRSGQGAAVHIVNNAAHIGALNRGHSSQAPAGFIEAALSAGRRAVRGIRVSFK